MEPLRRMAVSRAPAMTTSDAKIESVVALSIFHPKDNALRGAVNANHPWRPWASALDHREVVDASSCR